MNTIIYNYRSGKEIIPKDISDSVLNVIRDMDYSLGKYDIKNFKDDLSDRLQMEGWSGQVKLSTKSQISITSVLKGVGLCTQTGNMARMYADLLKLQSLYLDDTIKAAIFVLPTKNCANAFGGNVANYHRFLNELTNIFYKVITIPMIVIGFENN